MSRTTKPRCPGSHHYHSDQHGTMTYYKRLYNKWERQFVRERLHVGLKEDESLPDNKDARFDRWYYD